MPFLRRRDDFTHVIHDTVSILYCNTQQLPQGVITQSSSRELLQPLGLEEGDAHSQTFFFLLLGSESLRVRDFWGQTYSVFNYVKSALKSLWKKKDSMLCIGMRSTSPSVLKRSLESLLFSRFFTAEFRIVNDHFIIAYCIVPENMHTPSPWYVFLELHIIGFKLVSFIIRVIMAVFSQYNTAGKILCLLLYNKQVKHRLLNIAWMFSLLLFLLL